MASRRKHEALLLALWMPCVVFILFSAVCRTADAFSSFGNNPSWQHRLASSTSRRPLFSVVPSVGDDAVTAVTSSLSDAALWHRERRRQMLQKYGDRIAQLEQDRSQNVGLPLLLVTNASLLGLAIWCGSLSVPAVVLLAVFPGSIFSLWQLQILHDVLHGSFFEKGSITVWGLPRQKLQDGFLFWGSMPSAFGYYLYLKFGHLTHHKNVGDPNAATLEKLFDSSQVDFEDGDVLFVAHRMKLKGDVGPKFQLPGGKKELKMSISKSGFNAWQEGNAVWNTAMFASSFLFERLMLVVNDAVVAVSGRNFFFPNKLAVFHQQCATYARCATLLRAALWATVGWKALLFLYLSETLWSIPPHPASAMFVTNHGSTMVADDDDGDCVPTSSTYSGKWYSLLTLGTNYHCEHHDFPTIPFHRLGELRKIAPEFYREGSTDLFATMTKAFAHPEFYACMDAGIASVRQEQQQDR